jgi:hypothetical protein
MMLGRLFTTDTSYPVQPGLAKKMIVGGGGKQVGENNAYLLEGRGFLGLFQDNCHVKCDLVTHGRFARDQTTSTSNAHVDKRSHQTPITFPITEKMSRHRPCWV